MTRAKGNIRQFTPPRQLMAEERELLEYLLNTPFTGNSELQQQSQSVGVSEECVCGCRTIILSVDSTASEPAPVTNNVPVQADAIDDDGVPVSVIVHVHRGYLSELEALRADSKPLHAFPKLNALDVYAR